MNITVRLYATLRRYQPGPSKDGRLSLDLPSGANIGLALKQLGIPDEVALVAMVNDKVQMLDFGLSEADTLSLFPPVAGG